MNATLTGRRVVWRSRRPLSAGLGWSLRGRPHAQVAEDALDHVWALDHGDDAHLVTAARAGERVDLVDVLNQVAPGGPNAVWIRLDDGRFVRRVGRFRRPRTTFAYSP